MKSWKQVNYETLTRRGLGEAVKTSTRMTKRAEKVAKTGNPVQKWIANEGAGLAARRAAKAFDTALYAQFPAAKPKKK